MTKIIPTEEEVRLLKSFSSDHWASRMRKLRILGVDIESASVTKSGVVAVATLDGQTPLDELKKKANKIRVILDVKDSDLIDINPGGRSSRVTISVRTRRATDGMDMLWHPGITSLGVDTVTGEEVHFPWNQRILIGGSSGSGKSWSGRSLITRAIVDPHHIVSCFVDGKGDDANIFSGVAPTAVTDEEIIDAIETEHAVMLSRKKIIAREGLSKWNLNLGPRRIFFIDEGQKVLSVVRMEDIRRKRPRREDEEYPPDSDDVPVERKLEDLSSQARSREIILIWATQNPIMGASAPGITSMIRANFDYSFCLRVAGRNNTDTILGSESGVYPHLLPREDWVRGHGFLNTHNENLIKTWEVTDEAIRSLASFR
ncbi:hypothetical protein ABT282_08230 [Streptomyces sp. NPDC000927]|uniref:hypothetical protein n=1 Tax=Streptomyces sp. NPDC000927 TaxID=3154371 RepID=UPI00331C11DF